MHRQQGDNDEPHKRATPTGAEPPDSSTSDSPSSTTASTVVLIRSDPLDVPVALRIGKATMRKDYQNLAWALGYNLLALPIAAGVFYQALGLVLRPEIAALSMSGSTVIVTINALLLKRLKLPAQQSPTAPQRLIENPQPTTPAPVTTR